MQKLSGYIDELVLKPKLRYLFWEATTRCNCSCRHCGSDCGVGEFAGMSGSSESGEQTEFAESEGSLTAEEMCGFLDQVARDFSPRGVMLCITGGEPLMRRDLFDVMAHAARLGFLWGMTSNGVLISDDVVRKMADTNCKTVSVSLDGLKHSHNALRGNRELHLKHDSNENRQDDCFEEAIAGIKRLVKSKSFTNVQVTTVLHKGNFHELEDMYTLVEALGVDSWRLTNIEPIGRANQMKEDFLSADDFHALFAFIRSHRQKRSKVPVTFGCSHYVTPEYEMDVRDDFFICGAGILIASILHNGDIYGCPDIERKYGLVQGNIRKDRFADIWASGFSQFRQRRDMTNPVCAGCPDASFCRGDSAHTWDFDNCLPKLCLKEQWRF